MTLNTAVTYIIYQELGTHYLLLPINPYFLPQSGIELLFSRKFLWLVLSVSGAACIVLMFIPFSPYDEDGIALQRHYWFVSIGLFIYFAQSTQKQKFINMTSQLFRWRGYNSLTEQLSLCDPQISVPGLRFWVL